MPARRSTPMRRNRIREQTAGMHFYVPPETRERANHVARGLGITLGRYMEILIARDVLSEDDAPLWVDGDVDLTKTIPMPSTRGDVAA